MHDYIVDSTDLKSIKEAKKRFGEILLSTCEEFATTEWSMDRRFETVTSMINLASDIVKAIEKADYDIISRLLSMEENTQQ